MLNVALARNNIKWKQHNCCFLFEYQHLMNEQILVFRELTVFSLGSSPDVASETLNSCIWDKSHIKSPSIYA